MQACNGLPLIGMTQKLTSITAALMCNLTLFMLSTFRITYSSPSSFDKLHQNKTAVNHHLKPPLVSIWLPSSDSDVFVATITGTSLGARTLACQDGKCTKRHS